MSPSEVGITSINLASEGLTGVIPAGLFDNDSTLIELFDLDLSDNNITEVKGFFRQSGGPGPHILNSLILSNNSINPNSNFIDHVLRNMSYSEFFIDNAFSSFSNSFDFFILPSNNTVNFLSITNLGLTDTIDIDAMLSSLTAIVEVQVANNNLTAVKSTLPTNLTLFYIQENNLAHLSDVFALVENSPLLLQLDANNARTQAFLDKFSYVMSANHANLNYLNLNNNKLTGPLPLDFFERFDAMTSLSLGNNEFYGGFPQTTSQGASGPLAGQDYYQGTKRLIMLSLLFLQD